MTETRWERLTAPELRALAERDAVVVVPVAALEQHGPHLPVWTDSFIGHAVSVRAAELCADLPAVVLPPMWLGMSEHHFPFGGTISLDYATFAAVLRGIVKSLLADGFSRVMLFNSHGGNIDALAVSARELAHEFGIPVLTTTITKVAPAEIAATLTAQPGIAHACEGETSLWLHLDPSPGADGSDRQFRLPGRAGRERGLVPLLVFRGTRARHRRARRCARRDGREGPGDLRGDGRRPGEGTAGPCQLDAAR